MEKTLQILAKIYCFFGLHLVLWEKHYIFGKDLFFLFLVFIQFRRRKYIISKASKTSLQAKFCNLNTEYNHVFALLISITRFNGIKFYQNWPKIKLFLQKKYKNFERWGLCPDILNGLQRLRAPPLAPRNSPLIADFLLRVSSPAASRLGKIIIVIDKILINYTILLLL